MTGNRRFRGVDNKPGWINRALRDQRGDSLRERAAKRLGSSSIGPGGTLTVQDGAQIIFQGAAPTSFHVDTVIAPGPGDLLVPLSFKPIPNSADVKWNGQGQVGEWTIDGWLLTLNDPAGRIRAGDLISVEYPYLTGAAGPTSEPAGVLFDWASEAPALLVTEGDMTDRSGVAFDDSSWTVGPGAWGYPSGTRSDFPTWAGVTLAGLSANLGVWVRRSTTFTGPGNVEITVRVDGEWWMYVDGNEIANHTNGGGGAGELGPFGMGLGHGPHVFALHVNDDVADVAADKTYADFKVEVL